jgi:hypothetical protein
MRPGGCSRIGCELLLRCQRALAVSGHEQSPG